ncbi:hypothetical protein D9619_011019 [Psilocybe cf. subviscida]|uniref:Nephrocystin 3-like N-terminal domain-containing protein n=1 Tax=Psilocybe cf. subviscida TaxID=2480587 RepID=A0A8H5BA79_9AGAR|nr:hypothetical protein D9619_011019 [Psilocybe cf. subviscida]
MASILSGASNITISGGTFAINQNHSSVTVHTSAFDKLSATAAHSALHDAPARTDGSRCYPHTRTNDLDHLERWAQGICDEGASVFWLHGGAGVGRSAIMQSLAELCATQGLTLGSFFFSRSDPTRNTAEVLIPTLAYQLAQLFPSAHDVLEPVMNYDPLIFKKSLQVQLLSLFVRPLQHLVQLGAISNNPQSPRVFLIDGLDECGDATQQQAIIQAVAAVCHEHSIPVKFIIASRPETSISTSFRWYKRANHVLGAISLSEDPNAKTDIRRFVKAELHEIHTLHPFHQMIPSDWPHFYDINRLVQKSSSHFIYASTAMKYIWSAKENPVRSLQVVLGLEISRTISPFPELDGLYHHILGSAAHRDAVFQILAHCLFARLPPSVGAVCMTLKCSPDDFFIYMADMTSLVDFPHDQAVLDLSQMVTLLHASLRDFLFDRPRSGLLYIDRAVYLASQLENCLQLLSSESRQKCNWLDWVGYVEDGADRYPELNEQVLETIMVCGHLATTQQVLQQYSLLGFNQCTLDYRNAHWPGDYYIYNRFDDLIKVLVAANSIKTPDGVQLFKSFLDDFFDILEAYICEERKPLAPAILPLMLLGYPAQAHNC